MSVKEKLKNVRLVDNLEKEVKVDYLWSKYAIFIIGLGVMSIDDASEINEVIFKKYGNNKDVTVSMIARTGEMPDFVPWDFVRTEVTKRTQEGEIALVDFDDSIVNILELKLEDVLTCVKVFNADGEEKLTMYNAEIKDICNEIEKVLGE